MAELRIGFDLLKRDRASQSPNGGYLHHQELRVLALRVGVGSLRHAREPDDGLLVAGVVDQRVVPGLHRGEVLERDRVAHAVPNGGLLAFEVVPTVRGRLGLEEPMVRHTCLAYWIRGPSIVAPP